MNSPESSPQLLDRPDRKLMLVGRGFSLGKVIGSETLALTGLEGPKNVLVIASPADNPEYHKKYTDQANNIFGTELKAKMTSLHEFGEVPSQAQIEDRIGAADVIWISGGSTANAVKLFNETGIGQALYDSKAVVAGGSAGAILPSNRGMSWYTPGNPELNDWKSLEGMGMLNAIVSPHLDYVEGTSKEKNQTTYRGELVDKPRSHYFVPFLESQWNLPAPGIPELGIGIFDRSALAFNGNTFRAFHAEDALSEHAVTTYRQHEGQVIQANFAPAPDFQPAQLLRPVA